MRYFNKELTSMLILKNGYSRKVFAKLLNVNYITFLNWLNGKQEPGVESLGKLAKLLNVKIDQLTKLSNTEKYNKRISENYFKKYIKGEL